MPEPTTRTEYPLEERVAKQIANAFTYHAPKGDQAQRYHEGRELARELAFWIATHTPPGREQALALTKLEESVMFANAAIARGE
jgi:hypothetical protein